FPFSTPVITGEAFYGALFFIESKRITFLARDGGDAAYLALALCQAHLEFRATGSRARSLSLYCGRCCGKRCDASIGTGAK
ncbi:MAG: hypothetical protein WCD39_00035, partial [Methyloceanibacter sp.]